ncbi:MAG: M20/M25/M40 family metallo-hydrolase [Promethearchaeota archaeon]
MNNFLQPTPLLFPKNKGIPLLDPSTSTFLEQIYSQISEESYYQFCQYLSDEIGSRAVHETSNTQARAWLQNTLELMSSDFEFTIYPEHGSLVAKLPRSSGNSELRLLVGAHYDTVPGTNGCDDNTSGVSSTLEIARVLSNYSWPCDLFFAFFNAEETGRHGSQEVAQQFSLEDRPTRVFTLDMILWKEETGIRQVIYDDRKNDVQSKFFGLLMQNFSLDLGQTDLTLTPRQGNSNWDLSDNSRFWNLDIPTILLTEENPFDNPYYHLSSDVISNPDYDFDGARDLTATLAIVVSYLALNSADDDSDGLIVVEEEYLKTDPLNNDTDNDDLTDLAEILRNSNPLNNDTDGDGVLDGKEMELDLGLLKLLVTLFPSLIFGLGVAMVLCLGILIMKKYKRKHS